MTKPFPARLPDNLYDALRARSEQDGSSMNSVLVSALDSYLTLDNVRYQSNLAMTARSYASQVLVSASAFDSPNSSVYDEAIRLLAGPPEGETYNNDINNGIQEESDD